MKPLLTDAQLERAVTLFAAGKTRAQVITLFIDSYETLAERDTQDTAFRAQLSDALRTADPTSTRFAKKYQSIYDLHREALQHALHAHYDILQRQILDAMEKDIEVLDEMEEDIDHLIETADRVHIENVGALLSARADKRTLRKEKREIRKNQADRIRCLLDMDTTP